MIIIILGLNVADKGNALRFGDAELNSGTRIHFVEIPKYQNDDNHIERINIKRLIILILKFKILMSIQICYFTMLNMMLI
jgi:hypothetical protein